MDRARPFSKLQQRRIQQLSATVGLELGLEQQHVLSQLIGWDSPWTESILVKSESRLKTKRFGKALDVIAHLDWNVDGAAVMDLVLLAFEPRLQPWADAFFSGRGPSLRDLLPQAEIRRLDERVSQGICKLTYEYEMQARHARWTGRSVESALDLVIRNIGLVPPRTSARRDEESAPATTRQRFIVALTKDTVFDTQMGVTWQRARSPELLSMSEARAYASNLALRQRRWRLPSRTELQSLLGKNGVVADAHRVFPDLTGWYWSGTVEPRDLDFGWAISMTFSEARTCLKTTQFRGRCVSAE